MVLAAGAALISGLSIYLNAFAVRQLPDPAVFTALKNAMAAMILLAVVLGLGAARGLGRIERRHWPAVLAVGVIGGGLPFILFFVGLAEASAPSAAFIQKTLFVWVALLAVPFLGERLSLISIAGLAVLLVGQVLVLPPSGMHWATGETLILAATALWSVETILVKRLLGSVPFQVMAIVRLGIGLVVLFGYAGLTGKLGMIGRLDGTQWSWVVISGLLLAGYVATWFAALERAPASAVASVLVVGAVVTGALSAASRGSLPSVPVVAGYLLIVAATVLIIGATVLGARLRAQRPAAGRQPADLADVGLD
ncbi:MAG: DMT family transporter [Candidatus Limnocylindrales bacterium]